MERYYCDDCKYYDNNADEFPCINCKWNMAPFPKKDNFVPKEEI